MATEDQIREANHTELAEHIHKALGLTDTVCTPRFIRTAIRAIALFDTKQNDYGPRNISEFGEMGVIVRMNDKVARIKNLCFQKGVWCPKPSANESLLDTYIDVANYALIAMMCHLGLWPDVEGRAD